jgi:hypothetical protein
VKMSSKEATRELYGRVLVRLREQRLDAPAVVGVALLRLRAALALGTFGHRELADSHLAELLARVESLMPWDEAVRTHELEPRWPPLAVVWERCMEVIKREAVLRPEALAEALDDLVERPMFERWELWEREARRLMARVFFELAPYEQEALSDALGIEQDGGADA